MPNSIAGKKASKEIAKSAKLKAAKEARLFGLKKTYKKKTTFYSTPAVVRGLWLIQTTQDRKDILVRNKTTAVYGPYDSQDSRDEMAMRLAANALPNSAEGNAKLYDWYWLDIDSGGKPAFGAWPPAWKNGGTNG